MVHWHPEYSNVVNWEGMVWHVLMDAGNFASRVMLVLAEHHQGMVLDGQLQV